MSDTPETIPFDFDHPTSVIDEDMMDVDDSASTKKEQQYHPAPIYAPMPTKPAMSYTTPVKKSDADQATPVNRPYKCQVPGCGKTYKNPGGLKYHMQHGHVNDLLAEEISELTAAATAKRFKCEYANCGKRYKNMNGLKVRIAAIDLDLTNSL